MDIGTDHFKVSTKGYRYEKIVITISLLIGPIKGGKEILLSTGLGKLISMNVSLGCIM